MLPTRTAILALTLGTCAATARQALAQDAHYWNNQYGTKAQLLGGLVVGSYVDLSATYYNPGAVAAIDQARLIVGHSTWELVNIKGTPTTGEEDKIEGESTRLRSVPSMIAIGLPIGNLGRHKLIFSTLTRYNYDIATDLNLITTREDLESGRADEAVSFEGLTESSLSEGWGGITWAYPITPKIGIGATTYLAFRSQRFRDALTNATVDSSDIGSTTILVDEVRYSNVRLLWKLGAAFDLRPLTLGLTVTTPGLNIWTSGRSFIERSLNNVTPPLGGTPETELVASRQDDLPGTYKSPLSVAAGATYEVRSTRFFFTAEWFDSVDEFAVVDAEPVVGQTTGDTVSIDWSQRWRSVTNWGLGIEHTFSETFRLYGSFFTDFSAIEQPYTETSISTATWDIYHVTAGSAFQISSIHLTVGLSFGFGDDSNRAFLGPAGTDTADFTYRSLKLILGFGTTL